MKKKQLLSLPVSNLETELCLPDEEEKIIKCSYGNYKNIYKNYIYTARVDESTGEKILLLDFYKPSGEHIRRHFQDKKGNYFSYIERDNKISTAGIDYIINYSYYSSYHCSKGTQSVIYDFLNVKGNLDEKAIDLLAKSNNQNKAKKLKVRYDKIRKSVSDAMLEIRELPRPVFDWIEKSLTIESRYIFYEYQKKKNLKGYCTYCQNDVIISEPRDNQKGICPHCHSKVTYKAKGRFDNSYGFTDRNEFYYFQKTSKGFCVRRFEVSRRFSSIVITHKSAIENNLHESQRAFFVFNKDKKCFEINSYYEWGEFRNTGHYEWNNVGTYQWVSRELQIYPSNLNKLLKHKEFTAYHTDFNMIARKCKNISPEGIIKNPQQFLIIGHLANAKLYELAKELINTSSLKKKFYNYDLSAKSIKSAFGISKIDLPTIQQLNPNFSELNLYQFIQKKEGTVNLDNYNFFRDYSNNCKRIERALNYCSAYALAKYSQEQVKDFNKSNWHSPLDNFIHDWIDYLGNAVLLGMNIKKASVKFPRDFKTAHDAAYEAVNAAEATENGLQIVAIANMEQDVNNKYYFADKNFLIRAPHDHKEIIQEGEKLSHCVARYAKSVGRGETLILFIRKIEEPEKPYYTLELNPENLIIEQCRGFDNCGYGEDIKEFIDKWKVKKLGYKADKVSA